MNVDALAILEDLEEDAAKDAIQLFTSPRNTCITHINNTFEVLSPPNKRLVALKGVTTSLKAYTWPHFTFSALSENVKYLPPELRGEKPPPGVGELDGVGINAGSRRGSRVHQEAEMFVHGHHDSVDYKNLKFHPLTNLVIDYILNPNSRRASVMSRESVDFGLGFDTWIPLGAEFKLYDEDCGIASAVDIVCINTNGTLCFIELKVGHAETWHASCGVMNGTGSSQVALTPLNQALVQVGIYGIIARHKYNVRNVRMVVLNVNYSGVREFCVTPDFLVQAVAPIYLDIKEAIRLEKEQRRVDREARKAERQRLRQYGRALGKKSQLFVDHHAERRSDHRVTRYVKTPLSTTLRNT